MKFNIINECKKNKLNVPELLKLLPAVKLKETKKTMSIEDLMEFNIGFVTSIIRGGK
jgi:hypothetical protein